MSAIKETDKPLWQLIYEAIKKTIMASMLAALEDENGWYNIYNIAMNQMLLD